MALGKKKMLHQAAAGGVVNTENFAPVLYTGNSTTGRSITGVGFEPDLIWNKQRNGATGHILTDSVRGITKSVQSHNALAEITQSYYTSFDSDGWTFNNTAINTSNETFVNWCFKAGGTAVSNTDGSITSSVSANTDAGFSIVKYDGATNATTDTSNNGGSYWNVGHGLSSPPEMVIVKKTNSVGSWYVGALDGWTVSRHLVLDSTAAQVDRSGATEDILWGNQNPTSTTFGLGGWDVVNRNGDSYIAYCFHSVDGYQKVGSYTSNASVKITTGFEPRWIMIKYTGVANDWWIMDTSRYDGSTGSHGGKLVKPYLEANTSLQEQSVPSGSVEFVSDGFYPTNFFNSNGVIYLAIA